MKLRPHFTKISQIEPLLPDKKGTDLEGLAVEVIRKSASLSASLHPITRKAVVELVRSMNSYYSNQIEGHNTHPVDIERALAEDYSHEPSNRAMHLYSADLIVLVCLGLN